MIIPYFRGNVNEKERIPIKITALTENTSSGPDILFEHGLSLYIETDNHRILFDMGQTDIFERNGATLGIDLAKVDTAVLSHGHYDHGGGLARFLQINKSAPVYITKTAFEPHYNGTEKYIGLDPSLRSDGRLIVTEGITEIAKGITLKTDLVCKSAHPIRSGGLTKKLGNSFVPDLFDHEQYLLIAENGKRVLISGCSHRGVENIMAEFRPDVLVGGFHFSKLPTDAALAEAAKELGKYSTAYYTCHCTGTEQYEFMKKYIKDLHYLSAGQSITV